ncbi:MAG: hypothetical protein QM487_04195 [Candidatus Marithrix sp.]
MATKTVIKSMSTSEMANFLRLIPVGDPKLEIDIVRNKYETEKSVFYSLNMKYVDPTDSSKNYNIGKWIRFQASIPAFEDQLKLYTTRLANKAANPGLSQVYAPDGSVNIFMSRGNMEAAGNENVFEFTEELTKHLVFHIKKLKNSSGATMELIPIEVTTEKGSGIPMTFNFINDVKFRNNDHPQNGYNMTKLFDSKNNQALRHPTAEDDEVPNRGGNNFNDKFVANYNLGNVHELIKSGNLINPGKFKLDFRAPKDSVGGKPRDGQLIKIKYVIMEATIDRTVFNSYDRSDELKKLKPEIDEFSSRFQHNEESKVEEDVKSSQLTESDIQQQMASMYSTETTTSVPAIPVKSQGKVPTITTTKMHNINMSEFVSGAPARV